MTILTLTLPDFVALLGFCIVCGGVLGYFGRSLSPKSYWPKTENQTTSIKPL